MPLVFGLPQYTSGFAVSQENGWLKFSVCDLAAVIPVRSAQDLDAQRKCMSLVLPGCVVPMVCSPIFLPGQQTIDIFVKLGTGGELIEFRIAKGRFHSPVTFLSFSEVDDILCRHSGPFGHFLEDLKSIASKRLEMRMTNGGTLVCPTLSFSTTERCCTSHQEVFEGRFKPTGKIIADLPLARVSEARLILTELEILLGEAAGRLTGTLHIETAPQPKAAFEHIFPGAKSSNSNALLAALELMRAPGGLKQLILASRHVQHNYGRRFPSNLGVQHFLPIGSPQHYYTDLQHLRVVLKGTASGENHIGFWEEILEQKVNLPLFARWLSNPSSRPKKHIRMCVVNQTVRRLELASPCYGIRLSAPNSVADKAVGDELLLRVQN